MNRPARMIGGSGSGEDRVGWLRQAIHRDPRLRAECALVSLETRGDAVRLAGEVDTIVAKRRLPRLAVEVFPGGVIDDLRVRRAVHPSDDEHARMLLHALREERAFSRYRVAELGGDGAVSLVHPERAILADARGGRVRLAGLVESLTHRRLAEVLAWWSPPTTMVENRLHVSPPQVDTDDDITDAVRMVLEMDPWIDSAQVRLRTRARRVRMAGVLPSREQREMAGHDAWLVLGVRDVVNDIVVDAGEMPYSL